MPVLTGSFVKQMEAIGKSGQHRSGKKEKYMLPLKLNMNYSL